MYRRYITFAASASLRPPARRSSARLIHGLLDRVDDPRRAGDVAVVDITGAHTTYGDLSARSRALAAVLLARLPPPSPQLPVAQQAVGCYIGGHSHYAVAMLATWRLGRCARTFLVPSTAHALPHDLAPCRRFVPLSPTHSPAELKYFTADRYARLVVSTRIAPCIDSTMRPPPPLARWQ